jgi:hypothetical protein
MEQQEQLCIIHGLPAELSLGILSSVPLKDLAN